VTLLDANILVYVYNTDAPEHEAAATWLKGQLAEPNSVGLCWPAIWAFVRICTNPRAVPHPLTAGQAFGILRELVDTAGVTMIQPGPRHVQILESLVNQYHLTGSRVSDAVLAAMAIENGATLASADRDFRRFEDLRLVNPVSRK
jgi:toxin-antitoxin system PIN domain toxin